jgi:hypothetical protein
VTKVDAAELGSKSAELEFLSGAPPSISNVKQSKQDWSKQDWSKQRWSKISNLH